MVRISDYGSLTAPSESDFNFNTTTQFVAKEQLSCSAQNFDCKHSGTFSSSYCSVIHGTPHAGCKIGNWGDQVGYSNKKGEQCFQKNLHN